MTHRLVVCVALSCLFAAWIAPAGAGAAKIPACGATDSDGNKILGSLALNDNSSTTKTYGTGKGDRHLALLYSVIGLHAAGGRCDRARAGLASYRPRPATTFRASRRSR